MDRVKPGSRPDADPNINRFVREPGHIGYAAGLGLGTYDLKKIRVENIEI